MAGMRINGSRFWWSQVGATAVSLQTASLELPRFTGFAPEPNLRFSPTRLRSFRAGFMDYIWGNLQDQQFAAGVDQWGFRVPVGGEPVSKRALFRTGMNGALELSWEDIWSRSSYYSDPTVQKTFQSTGNNYAVASYTDTNVPSGYPTITANLRVCRGALMSSGLTNVRRPKYARFASLRMGLDAFLVETLHPQIPKGHGGQRIERARWEANGTAKNFLFGFIATVGTTFTNVRWILDDGTIQTKTPSDYSILGSWQILFNTSNVPPVGSKVFADLYSTEGIYLGSLQNAVGNGSNRFFTARSPDGLNPVGSGHITFPDVRVDGVQQDYRTWRVMTGGSLIFKTPPPNGANVELTYNSPLTSGQGSLSGIFSTLYARDGLYWQSLQFRFRLNGVVFTDVVAPKMEWMTTKGYDDGQDGGFRTLDVVGLSGFSIKQPSYMGEHPVNDGYRTSYDANNFPTEHTRFGFNNANCAMATLIYWTGIIGGERKYAAAIVGTGAPRYNSTMVDYDTGEYRFVTDEPVDLHEVTFGENSVPVATGDHAPPLHFGSHVIIKIDHPDYPPAGNLAEGISPTPPLESGYCAVAIEFTPPLLDYTPTPVGSHEATWLGGPSSVPLALAAVPVDRTGAESFANVGNAASVQFGFGWTDTDAVNGSASTAIDLWFHPSRWAHKCYPQRQFASPDARVALLCESRHYEEDAFVSPPTRRSDAVYQTFSGIRTVGLEHPTVARSPDKFINTNPGQLKQVVSIPIDPLPDKDDEVPFHLDYFLAANAAWGSPFSTHLSTGLPLVNGVPPFNPSASWWNEPNGNGSSYTNILARSDWWSTVPDATGDVIFSNTNRWRFDRRIARLAVFRKVDDDKFLVLPRTTTLIQSSGTYRPGLWASPVPTYDTFIQTVVPTTLGSPVACHHKLRLLDCDDDADRTPGGRDIPDPLRFDDSSNCATLDRRDAATPLRQGTHAEDAASSYHGIGFSADFIGPTQAAVEDMIATGRFGVHVGTLSEYMAAKYTDKNKAVYDSVAVPGSGRNAAGYGVPFANDWSLFNQDGRSRSETTESEFVFVGPFGNNTSKRSTMDDWDQDDDLRPWLKRNANPGDEPQPPFRNNSPYDLQLDELVPPAQVNICVRGYEFACIPYFFSRPEPWTHMPSQPGKTWNVRFYLGGRSTLATIAPSPASPATSGYNFGACPWRNPNVTTFFTPVAPSPHLYGCAPPVKGVWSRQSISVLSQVDLGSTVSVNVPVLSCTPSDNLCDPNNAPSVWREPKWKSGGFPGYTPVALENGAAPGGLAVSRSFKKFTLYKVNDTRVNANSFYVEASMREWHYAWGFATELGLRFDSASASTFSGLSLPGFGTVEVNFVSDIFGTTAPSPSDFLAPNGTLEVLENYYGPSNTDLCWIDGVD